MVIFGAKTIQLEAMPRVAPRPSVPLYIFNSKTYKIAKRFQLYSKVGTGTYKGRYIQVGAYKLILKNTY